MEPEVMQHIFQSQIMHVYGKGKVQTTRIAAVNRHARMRIGPRSRDTAPGLRSDLAAVIPLPASYYHGIHSPPSPRMHTGRPASSRPPNMAG